MRGVVVGVLVALVMFSGCGRIPSDAAEPVKSASASPITTGSRSGSPLASRTPSTSSATSTRSCPASVPARLSLNGEQGRAFAFAPLDDPEAVTVEGEVSGAQAWSTSKVLVAAAFLDTRADGDPVRAEAANRRLITAALTRSDGDAVAALRAQIPGSPGRAMTAVLRSIGDQRTTAPDALEGTMAWSPREQVRFMAALHAGKVVSPQTSAYLLDTMRPIEDHQWGLGSVGATTFKGGWLRQGRVTRQMGLLDGYAVAISTDRGAVVRQSDGDAAHVEAMDDLATVLADRLTFEQRCG